MTSAAPLTPFVWNSECLIVWGDPPFTKSFDPPVFTAPVCTDVGNIWLYSLVESSGNPNEEEFHITVDGINNEIVIEALAAGSGSDTYGFTVYYQAPDGFIGSFTFSVSVVDAAGSCNDPTLTPSVTVD